MKTFTFILLLFIAGCQRATPEVKSLAASDESPGGEAVTMDLPRSMRSENWTRYGEGSCVHASTVHLLRWQGQYELADWWRKHHGGGEYSDRLHRKLEAAGLRYAFTDKGDAKFLDWALRTRRGAGVTYWPAHAVNLVHLDSEWAGLLDNNHIERITWVRRDEFIRNWQDYGGWAWTLVYRPPPPEPHLEMKKQLHRLPMELPAQ